MWCWGEDIFKDNNKDKYLKQCVLITLEYLNTVLKFNITEDETTSSQKSSRWKYLIIPQDSPQHNKAIMLPSQHN